MRIRCKTESFASSVQFWFQSVSLILTKKTSTHTLCYEVIGSLKSHFRHNKPYAHQQCAYYYPLVHGHVYSHGIFLKKANHYDNFNCYTLSNAKPVVGTSKYLVEPDYDVIKMAAARTYVVFLVPWDFFEESKRLLYFVFGMYGEDKNGCWQPWNRGRHRL